MKKVISIVLISILFISVCSCKKAENDVVNQSLVKDASETAPVTVRTEAPKADEASVSVPVKSKTDKQSETVKEPVPEPEPEPEPEPAAEILYESVVFEVESNTFLYKETPEGRVVTNYQQFKEFADLFRSFRSGEHYKATTFEKAANHHVCKLLGVEDMYATVITEEFFEKNDIVLIPFAKYRDNCVYELGNVYSGGKVELNITEYWKDEEFVGNCYKIYGFVVEKGAMNADPYFEVNIKKHSDDVYIDFESRLETQSFEHDSRYDVWDSPINVVVKSLDELRDYSEKYSEYYYDSFFSRYGAAFFKNNILVITVQINKMREVIAVCEDGTVYLSPEEKSHVTQDIRDYVRCLAIDRNQLKGEPTFKILDELYPK